MKVSASQLQKLNSPHVEWIQGSPSAEGSCPSTPDKAIPGALVFVSTAQLLQKAIELPAGIIIAQKKIIPAQLTLHPQQALFATPALNAAMVLVLPFFDTKAQRWPKGVHPSASVHPSAQLGRDVTVAPQAVIGEGCMIADGASVGPLCVVEARAKIGAHTRLHGHVFVGADCEIGAHCEIHPHTTIGADGFGFATDPKNHVHYKVPQLGRVVIEDDVEIGANCTVDRATLDETRIGAGTKTDNHCHFGHNSQIGKNALLVAGFVIGGSSKVGDNLTAAGGVGIADHITVTDNVTLAGRSAVTKDLSTPGVYMGFPIEPYRSGVKTLANLPYITEMRKQLTEIRRHFGLSNNLDKEKK